MFRPSEMPRGPWSHDHQHAGPPSALVARAFECAPDPRDPGLDPSAEFTVGRITMEILAPIPLGGLQVTASVVRPGKRVQMLEAEITHGDDVVVRARGWRVRNSVVDVPVGLASADAGSVPSLAGRPTGATGPLPSPAELDDANTGDWFPGAPDIGYHRAMQYRFAEGGAFTTPGPATCWMRMMLPLIAGEEPSPLQRVMIAADSGNGISATLDIATHVFINVDLTVHLHRMPEGEWVCLDSVTIPEPTGLGMSDTMLWDERGPIGRTAQTLLISER